MAYGVTHNDPLTGETANAVGADHVSLSFLFSLLSLGLIPLFNAYPNDQISTGS